MNIHLLRAALAALLSTMMLYVPTVHAEQSPLYTTTKTISLGAPDWWDYLNYDAVAHRVYVAHGDRITVVDVQADKVIGQVEGMPGGTHGIGLYSAKHIGFTDDGRAGMIAVFDLDTLKVLKTIKGDEDADGIVFDKLSNHFFVINGDSGTLTVVDPEKQLAVATINVGGKLEFGASDGRGNLYVNGAGKSEMVRINTSTNQVDAHWPMPDCVSPHGLAIDAASHRLFSSCANNMLVVLNTDNGKIVASLPIGSGTDAAVFDPKRKLIFSSNGRDGTVTVIKEKDASTFEVVANIKTAATARTMTIDPDTGRLFLAAAEIDHQAPAVHGRPRIVPGSAKLLIMTPAH